MKLLIAMFLTILISNAFCQRITQSPTWFKLVKGEYKLKSLSSEFQVAQEITPQLIIEDITENTAYIVPGTVGILLFNTKAPNSISDVAGRLTKNSLVKVLEIDYRNSFQHPDTTWKFTHEVWYTLLVNDQIYYTDFKIHNILTTRHLKKLDQVIALTAQHTGYDNYYDNGYPEYFHFLAFEKEANKLVLKFESQELDLECNCEFWEPNSETHAWSILENGSLVVKLNGFEDSYSGLWDGKVLIEK